MQKRNRTKKNMTMGKEASQAIGYVALSSLGRHAAGATVDGVSGWLPVNGKGLRKAFGFATSAQVLAFAIRTRHLARTGGTQVEIREGLGNVMVTLAHGNGQDKRHPVIAAIDHAASVIEQWHEKKV